MVRVFISYSHDSEEHRQFVRQLSDRLRTNGVECQIDQYVNGFPPGRWQPWMEEQVELADFVLIVCTPIYLKRFRGKENEGGRGVTFEGVVISQTLYDHYCRNTKFVPVIPESGSLDDVPLTLKGYNTYILNRDYTSLYRYVTGQPAVIAPPVGEIKNLPPENISPKQPPKIHSDRLPTVKGEFFGRVAELQILNDAWAGNGTRIIQFIAPGGTGKTKLLRHWLDHTDNIDALIAWSFYSQGSSEDKQVSATPFFSHAFDKLGSTRTSFVTEEDKGDHLADLLRQQRCVLVLDGLEPLQHVGKGMRGELKDRAIRQLLNSLAGNNNGLCIVTTRLAVHELSDRAHIIAHDLQNLAPADGVKLLKSLEVNGSEKELEKAVREYGCHALALNLLGNILRLRYKGDVHKRDMIKALVKPTGNKESQHAFKVMQAYEEWFEGEPELALLHLLGLFDHPIDLEILQVLWDARIPDLTAEIDEDSWLEAIDSLREEHSLLSLHEDNSSLFDCHPLIREYFGKQLQDRYPEAQQQAHARLYEYYKTLPQKLYGKKFPDTLAEMQPLFSVVAHGCAAGLHQQALYKVYWPRIKRKEVHYLTKKLGAFSDDLAVVAHFFTTPWQLPAVDLTDHAKAIVLSWAGFRLRVLGRLREAMEPMQADVAMAIKQEDGQGVAVAANNLSELQLTLGEITKAVSIVRQSVAYADKSGKLPQRIVSRTTLADALHQAGEAAEAETLFQAAEALRQEFEPEYPRLYSMSGFKYCDLLLAQGKMAAVLERAEYALEIAKQNSWPLGTALNQLSLGRAYLQLACPPHPGSLPPGEREQHLRQAGEWLEQAVAGLRAAEQQDQLPLGLLTRAAWFRQTQDYTRAHQDLREALVLAEPSGMRLHLTDYHLEAARLALAEDDRGKACEHTQAAAKLITETGYKRRLPELGP